MMMEKGYVDVGVAKIQKKKKLMRFFWGSAFFDETFLVLTVHGKSFFIFLCISATRK